MADLPAVRAQVGDDERRHPTTRETADHSFPVSSHSGLD
jgi:hypothetical protein